MKSKQFLPLLLSIIMLSGCQTNTPEIFPTITTNEQPQEILIQTHTLITATQMPTPSPTFTQTITPSSSETQPEIKFTFISETIPATSTFISGPRW